MAQRKTPGVYIEERNEFPNAVVAVETAVPVFVGYTQHADIGSSDTPVTSLAAFEARFGGPPPTSRFLLHASLQLFWANGGGACLVVSCGTFAAGGPTLADLRGGLALAGHVHATLLVIPDAAALPDQASHANLTREMLVACQASADRVALIDLWGGDAALDPALDAFRAGLAGVRPEALCHGAAYYPSLRATPTEPALPASAAIAGIIAAVDRTLGVWKAPANVAVTGTPVVALDQAALDRLVHPPDGLAVNPIRTMPGLGPLVWGARTLDANSLDWRYLHVRRTVTWLEQSINLALSAHVFEPNVATTWVTIKSLVSSFLFSVWKEGGLAGAAPDQAYRVGIGLGETMTPDDILAGVLRMTVLVAVADPAQFIELSFQQQMQNS